MAFAIGFLIGVIITFFIMCAIGEKIMIDTYMDGFRHGQEELLHRIKWRHEDDCK